MHGAGGYDAELVECLHFSGSAAECAGWDVTNDTVLFRQLNFTCIISLPRCACDVIHSVRFYIAH